LFLFFSNNLGCGTSLLISAAATVILLLSLTPFDSAAPI
jgi:hypothetical protein